MFKNKKTNMKVLLVLGAIPIAFLFQNCSKISLSDANPGEQAKMNEELGVITDDSFVIQVPVEEGAQAPEVVDEAKAPIAEDVKAPIAEEAKAPIAEDVKDPVAVIDNGKKDEIKIPVARDEAKSQDTTVAEQKQKAGSCADIEISDFLLSTSSLIAGTGKSSMSFEITDEDKTISLNKLTLKVKALRDLNVSKMKLILNSDGNKVLNTLNEVFELATPSAQTAGLKVHLDSSVAVKAGQSYLLSLVIEIDEQIKSNPNKCKFHPVIKAGSLVAH